MKIEIDVLEKLTTEYKDKGIKVSFEFNEFGLILRGNRGNYRFNRMYSYDYLTLTRSDMDSIVNEFVQEFEYNLSRGKGITDVC